jgi:serine/threonine protein kinase
MTDVEKYEVLEKIGHGSFGVIRKVRRRSDNHVSMKQQDLTDCQVLCRKEINYVRMSQKEREQLNAELQILSSLRHPNIVAYYHKDHIKATQDLHLYMEYCGNGDLSRTIRKLKETNRYADEEFVWGIFSQIVMALYRCHYGVDPPEVGKSPLKSGATNHVNVKKELMILHRDLKPENSKYMVGDFANCSLPGP